MRVAVLGAGPAGSGMAAMMIARGHTVTLWSPRGGGTRHLRDALITRGVLEGVWRLNIAADLWRATEAAEVILVAMPGQMLPPVLHRLAGMLIGQPIVLFAPAAALAPALLHQFALARGLAPRIGALPVPPILAQREPDGAVMVTAIRPRLWLGTSPGAQVAGVAETLFGLPIEPLRDVLAACLAEPGPLIGAAQALTPPGLLHGVGRLLLALAAERDVLSQAFRCGGLPGIAPLVTEQGGLPGSARPLTETGAGLAFLEALARAGQTPTPLISAALQWLEAASGQGFAPHPVLAELEAGTLATMVGHG